MKTLSLIGRRWHDGTNTYHTCEIFVDGVSVHRTPFAYGYGSQYEQSAAAWLAENGYLPDPKAGPLSLVCREKLGVEFHSQALDVPRKKDL